MTIRRSVTRELVYVVRHVFALALIRAARWSRRGADWLGDVLAVASWTCLPVGLRATVERPAVVTAWARVRMHMLSPGMRDEVTRRRMGAGS